MSDKIIIDGQEVKRRLAFIGQTDIDEEVIYDLLKSCGCDYTLDSVMDMILDTNSTNKTFAKQQSNANVDSSKYTAEKIENADSTAIKKNTNTNCSIEINLHVDDTIEIDDSDTDDDNDIYYNNPNWEDMSYADSVSQPSPPIMINICDNAVRTDNTSELTSTTDVEILEENNNDPNNNLDSIQIIQEEPTINANVGIHNDRNEEQLKCLDNPQPGCSKDIEDEHCVARNKIREEAQQICNLLPKFNYACVHRSLLKNAAANNRIELTLWDLLPDKRPNPQYSSKRKHNDDDCVEEDCTNLCLDVPEFKTVCTKNNSKIASHDSKHSVPQFHQLFNPLYNNMWNEQHKFNTRIFNSVNKPLLQSTKESIMKTCSIESSNDNVSSTAGQMPQTVLPQNVSSFLKSQGLAPKKTIILRQPALRIGDSDLEMQKHSNTILKQINCKTSNISSEKPANPKTIILKPAKLIYVPSSSQAPKNNSTSDRHSDSKESETIFVTGISDTSTSIILPTSTIDTEHPLPSSSKSTVSTTTNQESSKCSDATETNTLNKRINCLTVNNVSNPELISSDGLSHEASFSKITTDQKKYTSFATSTTSPNCTIDIDEVPSTSTSAISHGVDHDASSSSEAKNCTTTVEELTCTTCHLVENDNLKSEIPLCVEALAIYNELVSIFGNIDEKYIRTLCAQNFEQDRHISDVDRLNNLIDYLLTYDQSHATENNVDSDEKMINDQYANLLAIFPDADPTYLDDAAKKMYTQPDVLRGFIQSKLETHDYPTREQYYARQKITEQQKQYTTNFNIEQFLEIFPDPVAYFEDPTRICKFNGAAFEFLKTHFNRTKVATLMCYYSRHKHHLSLTANAVKQLAPDVKNKRYRASCPYVTKDIPLLQEMAFITHKEEISNYLNMLRAKDREEFEELKRQNKLVQCKCCYDDECIPSKCSSCDKGHLFCNSCIIRGTEAKLADGQTRIVCFTDCESEFSLALLQRVLPPTKFSIILRKRQEEEVMAAGLEGLVSCPFCYFSSIPPPEDRVFKCFNPECMKESCRICKELNHVPLKCEEAKSNRARLTLEEKMTKALVRTCYRCDRPFFKEEGCNKIYCVCGAMMCYICDKPIKGYDHFNMDNKARNSNLCPLWSNSRHINAVTVLTVAKETVEHMKQKDPGVEINTTGLLPQIPTTSGTSYENRYNANVIPVRAHKIGRYDA